MNTLIQNAFNNSNIILRKQPIQRIKKNTYGYDMYKSMITNCQAWWIFNSQCNNYSEEELIEILAEQWHEGWKKNVRHYLNNKPNHPTNKKFSRRQWNMIPYHDLSNELKYVNRVGALFMLQHLQ